MYLRDGNQMPESEEGAAFFHPLRGEDLDGPRVLGLQPDLLKYGFTGMGEDRVGVDPAAALIPSDEEAALNSGATNLPEVVVEGEPMGGLRFYETGVWGILAVSGMGLGAYHGYKRNNSVGWGIAWALLGYVAPVIVIPIAFAQGIGKPKGR